MGVNEYIKTIHSPNGKYTIDLYLWDQGATSTFGVMGERVQFGLKIQKRTEEVNVEWESNDIVSINNHILNLDKCDTFSYQ